ncbi:MAG TPA: plastocyanin/azurin family copper-binding protein [Acidimicrobiales bacterium]|nr:plastocyanin/azurin family copper-binding protein [Acidimicrobiales bacterium]
MRRAFLFTAFAALVAAAIPPPIGADAAAAPTAATVSMKAFAFVPASIAVQQGGTVTWTYDETPTDVGCESPVFQTPLPVNCPGHSTTAVDKGSDGKLLWDSGVHRAEGFPFKTTFSKPGTYHYICVVHGGAGANNPVTHMEGDVVVFAAAGASGAAAAPPQVQGTLAVTGRGAMWPVFGAIAVLGALGVLALRRRLDTLSP